MAQELQQIIQQILHKSRRILDELNRDEADLDTVRDLYTARSEVISRLQDPACYAVELSSKTKKAQLKKLFVRFRMLEKEVTSRLNSLLASRKDELQALSLHKKAKSSYNESSRPGSHKQIVDLKSRF